MHQQFVRKLPNGSTGIVAIDLNTVMAYSPDNNDTQVWLSSGGLDFTLIVPFARFDEIIKEFEKRYDDEVYGPEDDDGEYYEEDESWRLN